MIYPIIGWSKIKKYDEKRAISIADLVETTWLTKYNRPMEIAYDQGLEFIGHEFRKYIIETEYRINSKPGTLENPTSNAILKRIHQVLVNIVGTFNIKETYIDKYDPRLGILATAEFAIFSTSNRLKLYSPGQLVFGRDMIIPINTQCGLVINTPAKSDEN